MKILIIKGYARENGYTKKLTESFVSCFNNAEVMLFDTFAEKFAFCDGCNFCEENEKCKYDDLDGFREKFENADVVVFASPLYNGFFSAPLKALSDRMQVYYSYFYKHNKNALVKKTRKAVLISSSGRDGKTGFSDMEKNLKYICSVTNQKYIGGAYIPYTDTAPDTEKALESVKELFMKGEFI